MEHNAPLASDPGTVHHLSIMSKIGDHGGQLERDTSSWYKLVRRGLECHVNPEDFYLSDQHHGLLMPDLHDNCLTSNEGRRPLLLVTSSEGELAQATARQEYIISDGDKIPIVSNMPITDRSNPINHTKYNINSVIYPIDQINYNVCSVSNTINQQ